MPLTDGPFQPATDGLKVTIHLQPGASRTALEGIAELADGTSVLKARVGQPPAGGQANAALIKMLAKAWNLPKGAFRIVAGRTRRQKTLLVAGDADDLKARLDQWLVGDGTGQGRQRGLKGRSGT